MSSRRNGRVLAFQALFSREFSNEQVDDTIEMRWLDEEHRRKLDEATLDFSRLLIRGTLENLDSIDSVIRGNLNNWDFTRISRVERAILRISVYSMLFQKSIPLTVTINEAVDIAKEFGTDESYKFINGVLDGVRKRKNLVDD